MQRHIVIGAVVCLLVGVGSERQAGARNSPFDDLRILGELAAGIVGGYVVGAAGVAAEDYVVLAAFPLGSAFGVWAIANMGDGTGDIFGALYGSWIGTAAGLAAAALFQEFWSDGDLDAIHVFGAAVIGSAVGATIDANLDTGSGSGWPDWLSVDRAAVGHGVPHASPASRSVISVRF